MEADGPHPIAEALVSQLGKPHPAHDWSWIAALALILAVVIGAEWLVGEAVRRSLRWGWDRFIDHLKRQQPK